MKTNHPHWAEKFLRWFCKPELFENLEGDLRESFEDKLSEFGLQKARWFYIREVLGMLKPGIIRPLFPDTTFFIHTSMIKNYLKVAFRQIGRHKLFSGLNIIGLASSMTVCLLIIMILADQFGYDTFHEKKDRIYRVISDRQEDNQYLRPHYASAPIPIADKLKSTYPWVEQAIGMNRIGNDLKYGEKIIPSNGIWASQSFFDIFSFGWVSGDSSSALSKPNSIIITAETHEKLFDGKDALGKLISIGNWGEFIVTGIMPDPPKQSHIQFQYLLSTPTIARLKEEGKSVIDPEDWRNVYMNHVYVLLKDIKYEAELGRALDQIAEEYSKLDEKNDYLFGFQPFTEIAPGDINLSNPMGMEVPRVILYALAGLGFLILLLACFNYTNLSIARALKRAREIGIRKVSGAKRRQIIAQFLLEAILTSIMALLLSVFLLEFLIEGFYGLDPFIRKIFALPRAPWIYLIFFVFSIFTGIIAGLLPAIHLSSFSPVNILKGLKTLRFFSYVGLRKTLLVIQFTFSLIFIISTLIIIRQQHKLLSTELGLNTENILNVDLQGQDFNLFKQKAQQIPSISEITGSAIIPASGVNIGINVKPLEQELVFSLDYNTVCGNYLENVGLTLIAGNDFPHTITQDHERFIMLNEKAVSYLGYDSPEDAIGKRLVYTGFEDDVDSIPANNTLQVIGVIKDFHYQTLGLPSSELGPYALRYNPENVSFANIKVEGSAIPQTIESLKDIWPEFDEIHPFKFSFFDEDVAKTYLFFTASSRILGLLGTLAIIIACLGLLGMATYTVESRIKEIGIRKVLGASERGLIWKLSKGFMWLLGIAILIAVPISIFLNQLWLENFAIRIDIGPGILSAGVGILLILSLLAVVSQTWRAAKTNPADTLRAE